MSLPLSFAQKRIASLSGGSADAATSIRFVDQQFIAEIRMVKKLIFASKEWEFPDRKSVV